MAKVQGQRIILALAGALALAIPAEGIRQFAYQDSASVLTVCWGSTTDVQAGKQYTQAECVERLSADMLGAMRAVERCVPGLPWNQLAAWSDAVYNLGPRIVCDTETSTAARLLQAGQREAACRELDKWVFARVGGVPVKLPGLVKRRQREKELCLGDST